MRPAKQGSMSHWAVAEPAAFERANYVKVLGSYTLPSFARAMPRRSTPWF
jgi:dihydroorotate dehydrogenase (fumarate)